MSTRSLIAIQNSDAKSCRSLYLHFDGYPSGAGRILIDHYTTAEKAEALLSLGSLSALGERLAPEPGEKHNYEAPAGGICIAYHRDCGEKLRAPTVWNSAEEMLSQASDKFWAEYCYLFREGNWYVDSTYQRRGWRLVSEALEEHDDE